VEMIRLLKVAVLRQLAPWRFRWSDGSGQAGTA